MSEQAISAVFQFINEKNIRFVDLRFTDTRGKEQHVTVPVHMVDADFFQNGKSFDGSSIEGWRTIHSSDMVLLPDATHPLLDPFFDEPTLILRCDVIEPGTWKPYERDPRAVAKRAEHYLKHSCAFADTFYLGPEPEFFIFDDVRWEVGMDHCFYRLDAREAAWNSSKEYEEGNFGHRPRIKGGYFPVPPVDSSQDLRSAICMTLQDLGYTVETHHHEVATGNQCEINLRFDSLLRKADEMQMFKYVVHNVAHMYGKTATFMPKPIVGDNGSGMHCHVSLFKGGENIFAGDQYAGLSEKALHFIGGIAHHVCALNAFTNPTTNSYKRLVPGFEAPVLMAYSANNRSAAIRVPFVPQPKGRRVEIRFPDPLANPYLAFSALLMAGLDGIENKMHPGEAMDKDLYELPESALQNIPTACASLDEALMALKANHAFLLKGDVFSPDLIDAYIKLKMKEVTRLRMATHPLEFDMYYSG